MNSRKNISEHVKAGLKGRYRRERLFRFLGIFSIAFSLACLLALFTDIIAKGHGAFQQTYVRLAVNYDPEVL
ncbi:MAG: DUF3333 domain-containing protein, partial [Porticoccaceae bacterium]|nr:DUF3333 domain-containing protein [Porticoccaceae bacterium]